MPLSHRTEERRMENGPVIAVCSSKSLKETLMENKDLSDVVINIQKEGAEKMIESICAAIEDPWIVIKNLELINASPDSPLPVQRIIRTVLNNPKLARLVFAGFLFEYSDVVALNSLLGLESSKLETVTLTDCEIESEQLKDSIYETVSEKQHTMVLVQRATYRKNASGKQIKPRQKKRSGLPYERPVTLRIL